METNSRRLMALTSPASLAVLGLVLVALRAAGSDTSLDWGVSVVTALVAAIAGAAVVVVAARRLASTDGIPRGLATVWGLGSLLALGGTIYLSTAPIFRVVELVG